MLVAIVYLAMSMVFGFAAIRNGPGRFKSWSDNAGTRRVGGALNWLPCAGFAAIGILKLSHHV